MPYLAAAKTNLPRCDTHENGWVWERARLPYAVFFRGGLGMYDFVVETNLPKNVNNFLSASTTTIHLAQKLYPVKEKKKNKKNSIKSPHKH